MPDAAVVAATLRAYREAAGALAVSALVDHGNGRDGLLVEVEAGGPVLVDDAALDPGDAEGLELPDVRPVIGVTVDAETGQVTAMLGALEQAARAVRKLAATLGGATVVTVEYATEDPGLPLALAGRAGEDVILAIAGEPWDTPKGWPADG
jgi:3-hydroxyisobutyrate dehydrogenase-like beta-hydroxyacid dehydrogenase